MEKSVTGKLDSLAEREGKQGRHGDLVVTLVCVMRIRSTARLLQQDGLIHAPFRFQLLPSPATASVQAVLIICIIMDDKKIKCEFSGY